mgnify:CR=1 FL=1
MSIRNKEDIIQEYRKSTKPNTKSSSNPTKTKNAKCTRVPQQRSKNTHILSRSSKDQSRGLITPMSNIVQLTHNKPLKHRVNSIIIILTKLILSDIEALMRFSKDNANRCSLETTLT